MNGTGITLITAIISESSDCKTAIVQDLTTQYGQGSYPARNTLALYLILNKRSVDLVDTPIVIDNTAPLTVSQWSINLIGDSWYPGIVIGVPRWSAGAYTINQCVYHVPTTSYYKALTSTSVVPGSDPTKWALITDILGSCLDLGTNVEQTQVNNFTACNGSVKAGNVLQPLGQLVVNGSCKNWEDSANAMFIGSLVRSAKVNHLRIQDQDAQEIMDFVNNRFSA